MEVKLRVNHRQVCYPEGARWSSGIDAAIGARGRGSRPVYYLTVQRPWTSC